MPLTLSILRCPDGVPPETRRIAGGSISIGRSPSADWVLPDPERVLSKRHCVVSFENTSWQVIDTSANGTFVNSAGDRLASDESRPLRSGDRLLLGSYEIEATIEEAQHSRSAIVPPSRPALLDERLIGDPFPPLETDFFDAALPPAEAPADFGPTRADDVPAIESAFQPPRPSLELLPEDWDEEMSPPPAPLPIKQTAEPEPEPAPPPPAPAPAPVTMTSANGASAQDAFTAFVDGAGLEVAAPADPLPVLRGLGAAFRAFVAGLRRVMIARATIKGEFRIDQTMIQAIGNNPLKFSADDSDAMSALIGIGRRTEMNAERAVAEAMRDIRLHELAMATAMQAAVRELLTGLAPGRVAGKTPASALDGLPWRRAAQNWKTYEALHETTVQAIAEDFDSVFGASFVRAYERAMTELADSAEDLPTPTRRAT